MSCISLDLTLEAALADPIVAAVMRADRIDPKGFERLLRTTARGLDDTRRGRAHSLSPLAGRLRGAATGTMARW